jgi:iron(III) transport system substrate-binding protein
MKRTVATIIAAVAAFGLVACSSGTSSGGNSGAAASGSQSGAAASGGTSPSSAGAASGSASAAASGSAGGAASGSSSGTAAPAGKATIYAAVTAENGTALQNAFHKAYPNETISIVAAGTGKLVTRMEAEAKSGGVRADAMLLADPTVMPQLTSDGILGSYTPADASKLPSGNVGQGWFGPLDFYNVIVYKTGLTPVPKDWSDLTNPAYKGKIEIGDPSYSGTTLAMVAEVPKLAGDDFFTKLKANDVKIVQSTNTVGSDIASGARPIGITLDSVYRPLQQSGSPVQVVWPTSGAIPVPAPAAMIKGSTNPVAENFLNWLLTDNGQSALATMGYSPALNASGAVPSGTKIATVPFNDLVSQRSTILGGFTKVFGG